MPFNQSERPSLAIWPVIRTARKTIRTRPAGKARSIGAGPTKWLVSTRTGATKSATWTLDPIAIESDRSIRFLNAALIAVACSSCVSQNCNHKDADEDLAEAELARRGFDCPYHDLAHPGDPYRGHGKNKHRPAHRRVCFLFLGGGACEQRGMGDEREGQEKHIREEEYDRKRNAEPAETFGGHVGSGFKGSGDDQRDRREREHRRLGTRADRIEVLLRIAHPAGQHRGPEDQHHVPDDGTDDRLFHHIVKPGS